MEMQKIVTLFYITKMYSKEIYKDITQNITKIREQTSKASSLHQNMKKVHINIYP